MAAVVLSNSRRGQVTGCQYRWFLEQVLGLRRIRDAEALRLGNLWHRYLQEALQAVEFRDVFHQGVPVGGAFQEAKKVLQTPEVQADEEIGPLLQGMADTVAPGMTDFYSGFVVRGVEVPFCLRITRRPRKGGQYPGFCVRASAIPTEQEVQESGGWELFYCGVMDAILEDPATGNLWVVEHKTTRASDAMDFERDMDASFQALGYMLAAQVLYPDRVVCGVMFDAARKKLPIVPKMNQCKFCDGGFVKQKKGYTGEPQVCPVCNGTALGVFSKTVIETTEAVLEAALDHAPHLQHPEYQEYMGGAYQEWRSECLRTSKPFWFTYAKPIRNEQLVAWLEDTWQVGRQYLTLKKKKAEKEFCRHLDGRGCRMCPVRSLCLDGGEWDRRVTPEGFHVVKSQVIPGEVGQRAEETPVPEDDTWLF